MTQSAALGFRVHTGWAAMVATAGPAASPSILHRARVEMIAGRDPEAPPFVYHAAAKLSLRAAERLVRESAQEALARATEAIAGAIRGLHDRGFDVTAAGLIVGNRPFTAPLESILAAHSLIHTAEGELFRDAIRAAAESCTLRVTTIPARDLYPQATRDFQLTDGKLREGLVEAGRPAGKPWAQDQKEALLIALLALRGPR